MFSNTQPYTCLGHNINLSATSEEEEVNTIVQDFQSTLEKIDVAPLPVAAKLQAINVMATSKLHFYFPNIQFSDKTLDKIEDAIVFYVRSWCGLNSSSTRAFMFCARSSGGLGLFNPRLIYYAKKLSFHLSALNSDDDQTRHTARRSLELHMNKRKCEQADLQQDNFAGFITDNNYRVIKMSKVVWRKSHWIHLNELCCKLGIKLQLREDGQYVLIVKADEEVEMVFDNSQAFFTCFKKLKLDNKLTDWKDKVSQGRIARADNIDCTLSSAHLVNLHLSDSLVRFVLKARLQLTECNSLLHIYYPGTYAKSCPRCGFYADTISHALNGCRESKNSIQKRHNRLASVVMRNVRNKFPHAMILEDQIVKKSFFEGDSRPALAFTEVEHSRPDLCVIDHEAKTCLIVEVSVPFDVFVNDCYQSKFNRYLPLCQSITEKGYQCKIIALIVGSLGSVHCRFVSGLKLIGFPAGTAKRIAKYCSVSAMIGSKIIWKQRCKSLSL
jgi:hypothetical protein